MIVWRCIKRGGETTPWQVVTASSSPSPPAAQDLPPKVQLQTGKTYLCTVRNRLPGHILCTLARCLPCPGPLLTSPAHRGRQRRGGGEDAAQPSLRLPKVL